MEWLPLIIILPAICFGLAYGLQKKKRWAWYAGWVFLFFVAGGVAFYVMAMLFNSQTMPQFILAAIFTAGGAAVWTLFAVRWCAYREKFFEKKKVPEALNQTLGK